MTQHYESMHETTIVVKSIDDYHDFMPFPNVFLWGESHNCLVMNVILRNLKNRSPLSTHHPSQTTLTIYRYFVDRILSLNVFGIPDIVFHIRLG